MGLVSIQRLRIDVQLPEDHLAQLDGLNHVQFSLGSNREETYAARIAAIVPVSDPTSRTALVRIVPQQPVEHMRPGMSARVMLQLETGRNGVVIPRDAVLRFSDGRVVVWVVGQVAGLAEVEERRVDTGRTFDGKIEIVSGLSAGEFVIVRGNESLRSGQQVNVAPLAGL
jgi:RND family efflux transporter MFP subunit